MKKLFLLLLVFVIVLTSFVSCSGTQNDDVSSSTSSSEQEPVDIEPKYEKGEFETKVIDKGATTDIATLPSGSEIVKVTCKTDKDPYSYKLGEEIVFSFSFKQRSKFASCDYFKIELRYDGIDGIKTEYIDGSTGYFELRTSIVDPGFVMVYVYPCNYKKVAYKDTITEYALCGAGAGLAEIKHNGEEPSDFDTYWDAKVSEILAIDPDIVQFEYVRTQKNCDIYNVKIKCVDDEKEYKDGLDHAYVAGVVSVPQSASAKSLGVSMYFNGHGIYKVDLSDYMISSDKISVCVNAHAFDCMNDNVNVMSALLSGTHGYGMYYVGESNPDNVYYKNMLLRNLQMLRFLTTYYGGGEGGDLFNGTVELYGGSQGGFQCCAVAGLASKIGVEITKCKISFPWLSDMGSYCKDKSTDIYSMDSNWFPQGPYSTLAYFDSVFFARRITCKANVNVGLGDITTPAKGVTALYNELGTKDKAMTYYQNRSHGVTNSKQETFVHNGDFEK